MAFDEFCPGDKLSFDSSNKIMCLYFSFKELDAASNGSLWLCPLVARTTSIHNVDGRWSHMVARFLHRMFLGPHGFQMEVEAPYIWRASREHVAAKRYSDERRSARSLHACSAKRLCSDER